MDDQSEEIRLPFRISKEDKECVRLCYSNQVSDEFKRKTQSRVITQGNASNVIVSHNLNDSSSINYKGTLKINLEISKDVVLLFSDSEVICVPLDRTILGLTKTDS